VKIQQCTANFWSGENFFDQTFLPMKWALFFFEKE
jgi:hypothetical protein